LGPFDLPTTFAQLWIDTSVQMLRATSDFWSGAVGRSMGGEVVPGRRPTSTAMPWWKAPETPSTLDPAEWAAIWFPAAATQRPSSVATNPFMAAWAPWLPAQAASAPLGPMEFWQRAWLQNMPQFASLGATLGASFASQTAIAANPAIPASWQPVATAYRSANGHAMAAVLRTIADVVEPRRIAPDLAGFWLNPLGTRH
jgi:hypothetical protein